jgi:tripartite ATP-independent transporter DctP family solute receptor
MTRRFGRRALLAGTAVAAALALAQAPALAQETLQWAHVYEVNEPYHTWALWAADEIEARTDGRYRIEVFPASSLGSESQINQGLTLGTVDMIYTGQAFAAQTHGPIAIGSAPYMFRDLEHWQSYIDSDLFEEIAEGYEDASGGHKILAVTYYGQRHTSSNRPIHGPEDMQGLKIRVPDAPLYRMFPEATGASPTPIAFAEVYLALQQGVVDAQENPLPTIEAKKFYEVQEAISLTGHIIESLLTIVSSHTWDRLSEEDRLILAAVFDEAAERATAEIVQAEQDLVDWFRGEGVEVIEVDKNAFRELVAPHHEGAAASWSKEQYERIQGL